MVKLQKRNRESRRAVESQDAESRDPRARRKWCIHNLQENLLTDSNNFHGKIWIFAHTTRTLRFRFTHLF